MIQIYYGRGKGKTSAAVGAAVRAAGQGLPVLVVQFMKDSGSPSGEVMALQNMKPPVMVMRAELPYPIFRPPDRRALEVMKHNTAGLFQKAAGMIREGRYRMAVLDELGVALTRNWLDHQPVRNLLDEERERCELIITGWKMPRWLLDRGDLVTRMTKIRHHFDTGHKARRGIEY